MLRAFDLHSMQWRVAGDAQVIFPGDLMLQSDALDGMFCANTPGAGAMRPATESATIAVFISVLPLSNKQPAHRAQIKPAP